MVKISDILQFLSDAGEEFEFHGDEDDLVDGFSSLNNYRDSSMTWVKSKESIPESMDKTIIMLLICQSGIEFEGRNTIYTNSSKKVFFQLIDHFFGTENEMPDVGEFTYISPNVRIGDNVKIGHHCVLDGEISIGDNTVVYNNVVMINTVEIGENCVIQSGVNLGHDGFAFTENEKHEKTMVRHHGGVKIGNDVLIGAGTNVARGTIDNTLVGDGSKIDAGCVITHNCQIGKNVTLICGSMIYGSAVVEDNVYIASAVIRNQARIGGNSFIGMGSVVIKDVDANQIVVGVPAKPLKK